MAFALLLFENADFYGVGGADYAWILAAGGDDHVTLMKNFVVAEPVSEFLGG